MPIEVCIFQLSQYPKETKVDEVILPTGTGQIGILRDHAWLLTALDVGVMRIRQGGVWSPFYVNAGFALVENNKVSITSSEVVEGSLIDSELAQQDLDKANLLAETAEDPLIRMEAKIQARAAQARLQASAECNK